MANAQCSNYSIEREGWELGLVLGYRDNFKFQTDASRDSIFGLDFGKGGRPKLECPFVPSSTQPTDTTNRHQNATCIPKSRSDQLDQDC